MCHLFAGQDPKNYAFKTRSIRLMGYSTSIRLEVKFWVVLDQISGRQNMTRAQFLSQLYEEALDIHGDISNFASLLRCCCVNYLEQGFDRDRLLREAEETSARLTTADKPASLVG